MANWPVDPAAIPNGADYAPVAHTHVAADVTDFAEAVDDRVSALLVAGSNVTLTYNDAANTLTVAASSGSGGVADGDKGDITISGSGTVWTVDNGAITYAKLQNVSATDKILGRSTAGAGVVEEITCTSQARQLLDDTSFSAMRTTLQLGALATTGAADLASQVTGRLPYTNLTQAVAASRLLGRGSASGAGDWQDISLGTGLSMVGTTLSATGGSTLADGDYGDITVSSSGTAMSIDNNVVTYAKMQDASAGNVVLARSSTSSGDYGEVALNASQLLGRGSTGNVAAITLGSGLSMSGTTLSASGVTSTKELVQASTDTAMPSSDTWYQAVETGSAYTAGTYLVTATITFNRTTTGDRTYMARLADDQVSQSNYASTSQYVPSSNPSSASLALSAVVTVPALGSYKFRLYGLTTSGSASDVIKAALPSNGVGNNATSLSIVRIA